jgi:amino acid permease
MIKRKPRRLSLMSNHKHSRYVYFERICSAFELIMLSQRNPTNSHTNTHTHTHTHTQIHTHTHICMYVCMYVCVYIYMILTAAWVCRLVKKFCHQNSLLLGRVEERITFRNYQIFYTPFGFRQR